MNKRRPLKGGLAMDSVQVCLLDMALEIAELNGWKTEQSTDNFLKIELPNRYNTVYVHVCWYDISDMLTLRIPIPFSQPIPEYAVTELCYLLNLMNGRCVVGSWYYIHDNDGSRIVWREEVHTDQSLVNEEQMSKLIYYSKYAFEMFYPVIAAFISAKPVMVSFDGHMLFDKLGLTPEEAMEHIDQPQFFGSA